MNNLKEIKVTNPKILKFITYIFALGILFFIPEVLFSLGKPRMEIIYVRPVAYILIFCINYYFFIDKFLFSKHKKWEFYVFNTLIVIALVICIYMLSRHFSPMPGFNKFHAPPKGAPFPQPPFPRDEDLTWISQHGLRMLQFLIRDGVIMVLTIGLCIAIKLSEKSNKWERIQKEIIAQRQEAELKNLKNQLNPHFLFNTLNNIYSLIAISQPKAQEAVHDLSQLLRYVLYDNAEKEVPLEKDLRFVRNYIELMKLRLTPNVELIVNIPLDSANGERISPLLFISLIENAFKHGVSPVKESFIHINIVLDNHWIKCDVENSNYPRPDSDRSGSGIGIKNLERQLNILYKDNYIFTSKCENDVYSTKLYINLANPILQTV